MTTTIKESKPSDGKISDEINQELLEGEVGGGGDWSKGWSGWVGDDFVLLADCASRDKFGDKN